MHNGKCTLKSCSSRLYIDVQQGCIPQRLEMPNSRVWTARTRSKCKLLHTCLMQVQGMRQSDIILEPTSWIFISIAYHSSYYINLREVAEGKRRSPLYPPTYSRALILYAEGPKRRSAIALWCLSSCLQSLLHSVQLQQAHFCGTYTIHARPGS